MIFLHFLREPESLDRFKSSRLLLAESLLPEFYGEITPAWLDLRNLLLSYAIYSRFTMPSLI